jgi:serine/threonine protein kinase
MDDAKRDIRAIFCEALDRQSPDELTQYLDMACGGNADLRAQVEELLASHREAGNFLGGASAKTSDTIDHPLAERPGMVIGPYKLRRVIGEGGMGTVYLAEQTEPVERKVALKVIKAGMDTQQVIARFEAERQALAMMDHANIARVLDVGTTQSGRPFFVMELVQGVPITKYCDDNHLTPRQRLELFVPVCQAIQHAHQKGIIHRDIKPSNVMITLYDGQPVPKVIDFGVAKATEQKLTERTLFTQYGSLVGTLEYMSPEQAEMSALGVDTRSDIFSLGVLLYELLTGSTPLSHKRLKEAAYDEILRMIREEEAPKPSTRLTDSGEALASISAQRHMEPAKLSKLMRGELDWIVMKTLEKDRNRRYETANGFAMDVQRYLNDEAVLACPPSAGYRFGKFARRNRRALLAGSALALTILLALVGLVVSNVLITRETNAKTQALEVAKEQRRDAQQNLEHALAAIDQMLFRVGHESLLNVPQTRAVQRALLQDSLAFYQKLLEKEPRHPLIRRRLAIAHAVLAQLHEPLVTHEKHLPEAEAHYRQAIVIFADLAAEFPGDPELRMRMVASRNGFADVLSELGKTAQRDEQIRAAIEMGQQLVKEFPENADYSAALVQANIRLAVWILPNQPGEAEKILLRNLALARDPFAFARTYHELGNLARRQSRYGEAEQFLRKALEFQEKVVAKPARERTMQASLLGMLGALGQCLVANERLQEAEQIYARAAALWDKLATEEPGIEPNLAGQAQAHQARGEVLQKLHLTTEAESAYRRSLDVLEKLAADFPLAPRHRQHAFDRCLNLGQFLLKAGRVSEAHEVYTRAEVFLEKLDGDAAAHFRHWQELAQAHIKIARRWSATAKAEEAEPAFRKMIAILDKLEAEFGGQDEYRGALANNYVSAGWLLHETKQYPGDREKLARRALAHLQAVAPQLAGNSELRHTLARSHHLLAHVLEQTARAAEAEVEFRQALPLFEQLAQELPEVAGHRISLAHVHNGLGRLLRSQDMAAAEQEQRQALALFEALASELPADALRQHDRAMMLQTVGVLRRDRGDATGAAALLEQAIVYAQKACDLNPNSQPFRDRLRSSREGLATTIKANESEKKDMPK